LCRVLPSTAWSRFRGCDAGGARQDGRSTSGWPREHAGVSPTCLITKEEPMEASSVAYPATFSFDAPERVANWRFLVHWLLAIPQLAILNALGTVSEVVAVISWFAVLFTARLPAGLATFQAMYLRYALRTATYFGFLRAEYPPFDFTATSREPGEDLRVRVDLVPQLEDRNRWTVGFRLILAIPHIIVLALLAIALFVVGLIAFFAVLFTGRWPTALREFAVGFGRWWLRVEVYLVLLTDEYPPFTLS
jgi:hypothetical protein